MITAPSAGLNSMFPELYTRKTPENLIISGNVVIECIIHRIKNKYVVCNHSLNHRAWNVTEAIGVCPECFNVPKQLSLF